MHTQYALIYDLCGIKIYGLLYASQLIRKKSMKQKYQCYTVLRSQYDITGQVQ